MDIIEAEPEWVQRLVSVVESGGLTAIAQRLNHAAASLIIEDSRRKRV